MHKLPKLCDSLITEAGQHIVQKRSSTEIIMVSVDRLPSSLA